MPANPPLPRPITNHNMFQSPRIDARRHSPAVLPNTNHRAKERGQNSIRSTCCAQSKIRKSTTAQVAIFLTKVRAMKGRMPPKKHNNQPHILFKTYLGRVFLTDGGAIGPLRPSQSPGKHLAVLSAFLHVFFWLIVVPKMPPHLVLAVLLAGIS